MINTLTELASDTWHEGDITVAYKYTLSYDNLKIYYDNVF